IIARGTAPARTAKRKKNSSFRGAANGCLRGCCASSSAHQECAAHEVAGENKDERRDRERRWAAQALRRLAPSVNAFGWMPRSSAVQLVGSAIGKLGLDRGE